MTLATRGLGARGPQITTVGFGAWAIGGGGWAYGWGAQDDAASVTALIHAVSRGINWVDTAALYGLGHSEEVVGRALCEIPAAERPYIFTKCGLLTDPAKPFEEPSRDLHPPSIQRECEASLRRLGVDTIDLYQFHWPDQTGAVDCRPLPDRYSEGSRRDPAARRVAMSRVVDHGATRSPSSTKESGSLRSSPESSSSDSSSSCAKTATAWQGLYRPQASRGA